MSDRAASSLLLSLGTMGLGLLACAVLGLVGWPCLVVAGATLVASAWPHLRRLSGSLPSSPWIWWCAVPTMGLIVVALFPDREVDVLIYHLAVPFRVWLVHKLTFDGAQQVVGGPLMFECLNLYPAAMNVEPLAHAINLAAFSLCLVPLWRWMRDRAGEEEAWLGLVTMAGLLVVARNIPTGKQDLGNAAFVVMGILVMVKDRRWEGLLLSAALFGMAVNTKIPGQAYALTAVAFACYRYRERAVWWVLMVGVMSLPTVARAYLWTANPLWPAQGRYHAIGVCDLYDAQAIYLARMMKAKLDQVLPGLFYGAPALLAGFIALPALAMEEAALLAYAVFSMVVMSLAAAQAWQRYNVAGLVLAMACVVVAVARLGGRRSCRALACIACLPPLMTLRDQDPHDLACYLRGGLAGWRRSALSTLDEAETRMGPGPGRVAYMAECRTNRSPRPVWSTVTYWRSLAWDLSRQSRSADGIAKRCRQRGIRVVLYNPMTEGYPHTPCDAYPWDARMLGVWREFVGTRMRVTWHTSTLDSRNGGFVLYEVLSVPVPVPSWLPYLPGVEGLYLQLTRQTEAPAFRRAAEDLNAIVPRVDWVLNRVGMARMMTGDLPEAWQAFQPGLQHGTLDDSNLEDAARVAWALGKHGEAVRLARLAVATKPESESRLTPFLNAVH